MYVQGLEWREPFPNLFLPRVRSELDPPSSKEHQGNGASFVSEICLHDCALVGHITQCSHQLRAGCDLVSCCQLVFLCMATLDVGKEDIKSRKI